MSRVLDRLRKTSVPVRICAAFLLVLGCARQPPSGSVALGEEPAAQPAHETTAQDALDHLLQLMRRRLLLMHEVARWKWNAQTPIADPQREQALLENVVTQSRSVGLDPELTRAFFVAQIETAKQLQKEDFKRWESEKQGPFRDVPDLAGALRPEIDDLSLRLLTALAKVSPFLSDEKIKQAIRPHAEKVLTGEGITDAVRDLAIEPLEKW